MFLNFIIILALVKLLCPLLRPYKITSFRVVLTCHAPQVFLPATAIHACSYRFPSDGRSIWLQLNARCKAPHPAIPQLIPDADAKKYCVLSPYTRLARYSPGVWPVHFLNERKKALGSSKPSFSAISVLESS